MVRENLIGRVTNAAKSPRSDISRKFTLSTLGVALIIIGAYLPWLQNNPLHDPDINIYNPYLASPGIEWVHLILLLPAGVVLAILAVRGSTRSWAIASIITGIGAVLLPLIIVLIQYFNHDMYYIPDVGWVLTVLGGLILALIGDTIG